MVAIESIIPSQCHLDEEDGQEKALQDERTTVSSFVQDSQTAPRVDELTLTTAELSLHS